MANNSVKDDSGVTLKGFGDFLDGNTIHFVGNRPDRNVCVCCGVLYCCVKLSKCLHGFCLTCGEGIMKLTAVCPLDGQGVNFDKFRVSHLDESGMAHYTVRCLNAPLGCLFEGRLTDLEQHVLRRCPHYPATCSKCDQQMAPSQLASHRAACRDEQPIAAARLSGISDKRLSAKKAGVEDTTERSASDSDQTEGAVKQTFPEEVARGEDKSAPASCAMEQTFSAKSDGRHPVASHTCALVRKLRGMENVEFDMTWPEAASVSGDSIDDSQRKQKGKSPANLTVLAEPEVIADMTRSVQEQLQGVQSGLNRARGAYEGLLSRLADGLLPEILAVETSSGLKTAMICLVEALTAFHAFLCPQGENTASISSNSSARAFGTPSASKETFDAIDSLLATVLQALEYFDTNEEDSKQEKT